MSDEINSPAHYQLFPGMEAIDVIKAALTPEEFAGYLKGNALKYRLRAGDKGPAEKCIAKANWYQNRLRKLAADADLLRQIRDCMGRRGLQPGDLTDELPLHGWPEDDAPRQQRIEQGGELAEVYEVLDQIKGGNQ